MTTPKLVAPKKLIEVALPLNDINAACAKEKSIRHGHPSTLHLWWARRPLAAARAVLFAQLVNDPSWKYTEEELRRPAIRGVITKKRKELFRLISELVVWENTTNENVLERARAEIRSSWRETCEANKAYPEAKSLFDPQKLPAFHDPFAGGGTIPLEAQRLGLESRATDLNPVAVLLNKALIEIPSQFAGRAPVGPISRTEKQTKTVEDWSGTRGLAEDVRRYGQWMRDEAQRRIGNLYPKLPVTKEMAQERKDLKQYEGSELNVIAWLWARTVKSPNPAFSSVDVPLVSSFVISTKPGKESWVQPVLEGKGYRFAVRTGKPSKQTESGTKADGHGANFICLLSGVPITGDYIKAEGQAGRIGARMMAIVVEGSRSRLYVAPTAAMEAVAESAKPTWKPDVEFFQQALGFRVGNYGLTKWSDLFTKRQLVALTTFADLVQDARKLVRRDAVAAGLPEDAGGLELGGIGASAYADAVAVYLAMSISKMADAQSSLCRWKPSMDQSIATFGRQAIPMVWDYSEANAFGEMAGDPLVSLKNMMRVVEQLPLGPGRSMQADAQTQTTSQQCLVSTDPPYYDNIGYADLSDFFYVWLKRALKPVFPSLFSTIAVPKAEELVATPARHGGRQEAEAFFLDGMAKAMHQLATQAHPCLPVTIYYAFKQSETETEGTGSTGWETFLTAVLQAGFAVIGTWPMRTELANRMRGAESNALASSIVLVCRAREAGTASVTRKDFARELDRVLPLSIADMTADPAAAIAPVDLAQACIGPGMAVFSKHSAVLEADGSAMSVHSALVHINKAIDDYFSQAEGELDSDTRFCIGWFEQHGFSPGLFGEADVLARAKGTAVNGVDEAGVIEAAKGKVRLYKIGDFPKAWDPSKDSRVPVWEALHQMCRALGESEGDAGALLAKMPEKQEAIRLLSYRLYTLCERKGWAELARPYNELITSWASIVEASHGVGHVGTQMDLV